MSESSQPVHVTIGLSGPRARGARGSVWSLAWPFR